MDYEYFNNHKKEILKMVSVREFRMKMGGRAFFDRVLRKAGTNQGFLDLLDGHSYSVSPRRFLLSIQEFFSFFHGIIISKGLYFLLLQFILSFVFVVFSKTETNSRSVVFDLN